MVSRDVIFKKKIDSLSMLLVTPVPLFIHAGFQSASHVAAAHKTLQIKVKDQTSFIRNGENFKDWKKIYF